MCLLESGLYLVSTPIGNLGDMSERGIAVLQNADLIAAEDTRHSRILLNHFQINTPMISYHEHNAVKRREELIALLRQGKSIAVITDAGTPAISDPGEDLVKAAAAENLPIHPIPGANALLAALIGSGLDAKHFAFEGFLPRQKKERRERLEQLKRIPMTLLFYVAPHHLKEDLTAVFQSFGERPATLCRELTKLHESFYRMSLGGLIDLCETQELKGEMVLVVAAPEGEVTTKPSEETLKKELAALINEGVKAKVAAGIVGEKYDLKKNDLYPLTFEK